MKNFTKILSLVLVGVMLLTCFVACGSKQDISDQKSSEEVKSEKANVKEEKVAENNTKERKTIGLALFYRRDEYYKDIESTFAYEANENGYDLIIQDADTDPATQMQQIEDFMLKGVDAIALCPASPSGLIPATEDAMEKDIPVFTLDGPLDEEVAVAHIGFDYHKDGYLIGQWTKKYIEENLGGKANVAVIDFAASKIVCGGRANGFIDAVTELPDVKIVSKQDGKASRTESMAIMENVLSANPDLDVVFGINYDTAKGAASAIEAAGRDDIIVTGLAWGVESFEELERGDAIVKAHIVPAPTALAENTIKTINDYFAGKEIPKIINSESKVYDHDNIGELDWRKYVERRKD